MSKVIDYLRTRLVDVKRAPQEVAQRSAPRIEEKFRNDARTKRGNVPCFGAMGNIPIAVKVEGSDINVTAADWVLNKAVDKGQVEEWEGIVHEEAQKVLAG